MVSVSISTSLLLFLLKACSCKLAIFHKTNRLFHFAAGNPANEIAVYNYVRHIFVAHISLPCANYALNWKTTDNKTTCFGTIFTLRNYFNMDDYLESSPLGKNSTEGSGPPKNLASVGSFSQCFSVRFAVCCQLPNKRIILSKVT